MVSKSRIYSTPKSSIMPWLGIATIVLLADQLSKLTILRMIGYAETKVITSYFNLVLVFNKGAAFSFLAAESGWQRYFFTTVGSLAALFIIWNLQRHSAQRLFCWALALILGGAVGNVIDRVLYGHVVDFLDLHVAGWHWPAFNLADSAICLGAVLFVIDELRRVNR